LSPGAEKMTRGILSMGSALTYVPNEVLKRFENEPSMKQTLETYGSLRKHEGEMCDEFLFNKIFDLQNEISSLKKEMEARVVYTTHLESLLEKYSISKIP
jgi:hypothetical protein